MLVMMIGAAPAVADTPDTAPGKPGATAADTAVRPEVVRVDKWRLLQSDGAQLYQNLCASCHGVEGSGAGPAARSLTVYPPPLIGLAKAGVPEEHWTYVILAPCDDAHHWGPHGDATMPCWQQVFRQALGGTDAGPMLVSAKLRTYLGEIQE
jgi:mono/diheme cytochrome c family protein